MHVTKARFWIMAVLLVVYLAGILILSAVTLHEPHSIAGSFKVQMQPQGRLSRGLEYGVGALRPAMSRLRIRWCSQLSLVRPPRAPVALASFPGSGNTWLRYLLQQATGLCTGSVYKDYGLMKNGFPAESVMNGSVLVVKTHEWGVEARRPFSKVVLLVRNPAAAIQAEFNRQSGGHIGFASPDRYKRTKGLYWQQFVYDKLEAWRQTNLDWLHNFTGPAHIIFYEQLVDNLEHTLKSVIDFLNVTINDELFQCAIARKEGIYRRKRRALNFDPYTQEMKMRLEVTQNKVYDAIYRFSPAKQHN